MAPSPIPAPLPPWARALLQLAPLITTYLQSFLEYIATIEPSDQPNPGEWRHVQVVWRQSGYTDPSENIITTFDIANITGGAIDASWNDADYATVEAALHTLVGQWATRAQSRLILDQMRFYRRAFRPYSDPKPFTLSGAPERVFTYATPGTGLTYMPSQVAFTHTEVTTFPRHWGRCYWPLPLPSAIEANGSILNGEVDGWIAAVETAYDTLQAAEFFPVVPVTQVDKQALRGLLTVTELQMDDVPDVVRRRRLHAPGYKVRRPVTP